MIGEPIPEHRRKLYSGQTHYGREIAIVEHSRVVRWMCPDCGYEWPRVDGA